MREDEDLCHGEQHFRTTLVRACFCPLHFPPSQTRLVSDDLTFYCVASYGPFFRA